MPLLSCTVSLHIFSFLSPTLDVCTWLGIVGVLLEFKWSFKTTLFVIKWSVSPLEMILALDVLHWKLDHLMGCCAAQPGVMVAHSSLPCWHVSCNSSMLLRYFKDFGFLLSDLLQPKSKAMLRSCKTRCS